MSDRFTKTDLEKAKEATKRIRRRKSSEKNEKFKTRKKRIFNYRYI